VHKALMKGSHNLSTDVKMGENMKEGAIECVDSP
jgi:hypothetical protein